MRKFQEIGGGPASETGRTRAPRTVAFALLLLVSPFLYEGGGVVVARWQSMYGSYREPRTPISDTIKAWAGDLNEDVRRRASGSLVTGNWNPSLAIPLAVTWAGLGVFFLRRGH